MANWSWTVRSALVELVSGGPDDGAAAWSPLLSAGLGSNCAAVATASLNDPACASRRVRVDDVDLCRTMVVEAGEDAGPVRRVDRARSGVGGCGIDDRARRRRVEDLHIRAVARLVVIDGDHISNVPAAICGRSKCLGLGEAQVSLVRLARSAGESG